MVGLYTPIFPSPSYSLLLTFASEWEKGWGNVNLLKTFHTIKYRIIGNICEGLISLNSRVGRH